MLFKILTIMLFASSFAYAQTLTLEKSVQKTYPMSKDVKGLCGRLEQKFLEYKWGPNKCDEFEWLHFRKSALGTPLMWTTFGTESSPSAKNNTTLILCGVHGDEVTPIKFCWDLILELKKEQYSFHDKMVVVVPVVTPDSFLKPKPTRTNSTGVDVNRNFPTIDWKTDALKKWKTVYQKDKRKFPGHRAASEQETIFQMNLIKRYRPNKVISVHSPLTILDYDGPSLKVESSLPAKALLEEMSKKSFGYKVSNYPIFPGSLGNWAGKENHIPTYTLELPNSNPAETDKFWDLFKDAVIYAVDHKMQPTVD